jgi:phosphoenolpyruvate phosphomutase
MENRKMTYTKKTTRFRSLLTSNQLEFICEAHSGLSAKIVEEAGFPGIWASGLAISAQLGVRDNNEASWTQVLDVIEFMADASRVPILLDGDTGYGNFNNVQRLVRKLEQRGIAAVCLEDKLFPKTNSYIGGNRQPLADVDEFCGKIKAGKDAQGDDDFSIVARVEAFIAGWSLSEAMRRAEAYHAAGADAILIHSALSVPDEVLAFKQEWGDRCPVVIVPTSYYATPTDVFREHGFSLVIWANHIMRASLRAMEETARTLFAEQNLLAIEDAVAPLREVFRLQGAADLQDAERRYLPQPEGPPAAIVLAASRGAELGELTAAMPKTMVQVGDRPLLAHIVATYNAAGINRINVVRGYCKEAVTVPGAVYVDNDDYVNSGELLSLYKVLEKAGDDTDLIVSYGDVLFRKYIVELLRDNDAPLAVAVDTNWRESANRHRQADYVRCSLPYSRTAYNQAVYLDRIDPALEEGDIHGEWMGFVKISRAILPAVRHLAQELIAADRHAKLTTLLNALAQQGRAAKVIYTTGNWLDIDSVEDVVHAGGFR